LNPKKHKNIYLDGEIWPAYEKGRVLIPPGSHEIQSLSLGEDIARAFQTNTRIVDISGELESCRIISRGLEVTYHSTMRNFLAINERPQELYLDNERVESEVHEGISGFTLTLPSGTHTVRIHTRTKGAASLNNFSMIASISIVALSILSASALVILYGVRFRKRRRSKAKIK
jgi:hypothetical protein